MGKNNYFYKNTFDIFIEGVIKMSKIPYIKEQLEKWCKESDSYNEVLIKSGRTKCGGNRNILKKYIELYQIDISHFTNSTAPIKKEKDLNLVLQLDINKKICQQCGKEKDKNNDYYWSGNKTRNICKDCVKENEKKKYQDRIEQINNYKKTLKCKKCGETRYYLFDFHHRNPKEKDYSISDHTRAKFETIKTEIDKCDVLCSNCHREWHYLSSHHIIDDYDAWLGE